MKYLHRCIFLLVFGFWVNLSFAQNYSVNHLLDSALQQNYLLQSNKLNTNIKQTEIDKLKTNYLPVIGTSASFSYWKFLLPNKERLLGSNRTDLYTDVTVYQTIYDFGVSKAEKAKAEQEILLNDEIQRQIRQTIILGVTDAYFSALSSEQEIHARQNSLEQLNANLKFTKSLYDIGKVSSVDILKIKVQVSVEEKNLQKAKNDFTAQKLRIKNLCYLSDIQTFNIQSSADSLFNQNKEKLFVPGELFSQVMENHPLISQKEVKAEIEKAQQKIYKLQNRPELFAFGIGSWEHGYIPFGDNFNYNIGLGIRYTLPYWGGSAYKYDIKKSNYLIGQLSVEKDQSFLEIRSEIDVTLNDLASIKEDIENQRQIIELATETISNAQIKYKAGQGSIIDILDAQTILTDATIAHDQLKISYLKTMARLHYLTGSDDYPF